MLFRIGGCFLFCSGHGDHFRGDRQFSVPYAGGPVDRMGDGGAGGIDHDLADGLCAKGAGGFVAVFEFHFQLAHIQTGGDFVLHEGGLDRLAELVVGDIFHQGVANALDDTALGLDSCQIGIDGNTAVHNCHVVQDLNFTGEFIQLDLHHAHHVGRRRHGRSVGLGGLGGGGVIHLGFVSNVGEGDRLLRTGAADAGAGEFHFALLAIHHAGGNGADPLF